MAQINKPTDYFNTLLWVGDGTSPRNITGVGFQPDLVWVKNRDAVRGFELNDAVRGGNKQLYTSSDIGEETNSNHLSAFISDGFTVGSDGNLNQNTANHVGFNWLASNTTASNTDGSITSTVSANTTSGFSIVSYTGTANSFDTVGHGLGVVPKMIIIKRRDNAGGTNWCVYHVSNNNTKVMFLESTSSGLSNVRYWNNTTPTSSVFTIGNDSSLNASGGTFVAYCFAEKKGFSKFGSYTGNGSADGTFVYTGFKPSFFMWKKSSDTGNWLMMDNKRSTFNFAQTYVKANASAPEDATSSDIRWDFLSNGLKCRGNNSSINSSGATYIYMAFAESPLVGTNNIPATAR